MKCFIYLFPIVLLNFSSCRPGPDKQESPPNVIILLADDQGWGDLSSSGNRQISTPHIDQLAEQGASFERFYVQPVCSPTRAEILTGRYHVRSGVSSTSAGGERIDLDEKLISQSFQSSGYRTACFGKWHSGSQHPYHPNSRGFDEYYGFTSGHWGHYFDPPLDHNSSIVQGNGYLPDDLTDHAIEFITGSQNPFFIFLAYNTPHSPMQVPEKFWNKFENVNIDGAPEDSTSQNHAKAAYAMVENLDWNIGRILEHLNHLKLTENTIILYMTDNGPNGIRWNGGMKGRKGSTDEGGVRSPLYVMWEGKIKPGRKIKEICGAIDLAPTLLEICQIDQPNQIQFDGKSLVPLMLSKNNNWPDRNLVQHWMGRTSVRNQKYRLDHDGQLFDMISDPGQLVNIESHEAAIARQLVEFREEWKKTVLMELPNTDKRPFPLGFTMRYEDHLPARDGLPHGNIQRSNQYPNDSYFLNWTSTNDSITWNTEILNEGTYEINIYYTCPSDQLGSKVKLKIGRQSIDFSIDKEYDTLLKGFSEDRVKRIESYVKEFKKKHIGNMQLMKGEKILSVRALHIENQSVIEMKSITLRRIR